MPKVMIKASSGFVNTKLAFVLTLEMTVAPAFSGGQAALAIGVKLPSRLASNWSASIASIAAGTAP